MPVRRAHHARETGPSCTRPNKIWLRLGTEGATSCAGLRTAKLLRPQAKARHPNTHPIVGDELWALRRPQLDHEPGPRVHVGARGAVQQDGFRENVGTGRSAATLGFSARAHQAPLPCPLPRIGAQSPLAWYPCTVGFVGSSVAILSCRYAATHNRDLELNCNHRPDQTGSADLAGYRTAASGHSNRMVGRPDRSCDYSNQ